MGDDSMTHLYLTSRWLLSIFEEEQCHVIWKALRTRFENHMRCEFDLLRMVYTSMAIEVDSSTAITSAKWVATNIPCLIGLNI